MSALLEAREETAKPLHIAETLNLVDEENPWLGLDSFSEETRQFFHGREEEIAELARRVQRKTLSILFGQSGLGKTSILRAGIVPRLRKEGFCPVYVRIDYARESPAPSQQIKQAIFRATEDAGKWTRPGSAVPGESLWEFLHHRDDFLCDNEGNALTPLLIFDQFEEIFTLGQGDEFGRARAAEFIEDLADLVENRPPKSLELMLETEDAIVERFDFERADYRILIALREDYLAHLEGLKVRMPSITQNRMRLARMTGDQALAAVLKPGGRLVTEEVAESIVRFIAGGSELRNAEVEPSLLSLVCRELNNTRITQKRSEISADLLAGSRETILKEFYERALVDQPPGVRRFIEDEMLTESGFRESLAEERVLRAFDHARAEPGALSLLVNRRLLRIEERLDMRRVELTHDVLCPVVLESRNQRHEREAKEEAERQLEAQRAREAATHRALVRARKVAAGCAALALIAVGGALFGYFNMKRAQDAEAKALGARTLAENARGEAEKLIVYLLEDFYLELEPVGRLDIVADLSRRALAYYAALPAELRTSQTDRNRALALVRYGHVLRYQGKTDEGLKVLTEATDVLGRLRREGDTSEVTAIGQGLGLTGLGRVMDSQNKRVEALRNAEEAVTVLTPLMKAGTPSLPLRRAYGLATNYLGFVQMRQSSEEEGVKSLELARDAFRSIDGLTFTDLAAATAYTEATAWQMEALGRLGREAEARAKGEEAAKIAEQVLERRPGHMGAVRAYGLINSGLGEGYGQELRFTEAIKYLKRSEQAWETFLKLDPGNYIAWNNLAASRTGQALSLEGLGRLGEAARAWRTSANVERGAPMSPALAANLSFPNGRLAVLESDLGLRRAEAEATPDYKRLLQVAVRNQPADSFGRASLLEFGRRFDYLNAFFSGEYAAARTQTEGSIRRIESVKTSNKDEALGRDQSLAFTQYYLAASLYNLKDYVEAEKHARLAVEHRKLAPPRNFIERYEASRERVMLGLTLARLGRGSEATAILDPEIKAHRELRSRGSEDVNQHVLLARALHAAALAAPERAGVLLNEARTIMDGLPAEMHRRRSVAQLRATIAEDLAKRS